MKIYCAGPLFTSHERQEMLEIASALEAHGYTVFLPQRDGLRYDPQKPSDVTPLDIFTLDVSQIYKCDGLVLNINGRVPDEGACVEAGIAYAANKTIVIYKDDIRSLAGIDNPLISQLGVMVGGICDIVSAFERACEAGTVEIMADVKEQRRG